MVENLSFPRDIGRPQGFASDGSDAVGFVQFWGNSPALDLLGENLPDKTLPFQDDPDQVEEIIEEPYNVLISGAGDLRHVIKTLAYRWKHFPSRKLHIYIHDNHPETLARHILLLHVLNDQEIPMRERVEIFMSIFGNSLIREKDEQYIDRLVKDFLDLVTEAKPSALSDLFCFSHLKYKDRDAIQEVIQGWFKKVNFDVEQLRDQRCRGYYRSRFDFKKNLMDADYCNNIKPVSSIIHVRHYKEFCATGVAFETRLGSYNCPNRTLASYVEAKDPKTGALILARGYWGDIINSPYFSFGIETDPKDRARLFKISQEQHRHTACDVAEFNLRAYLQGLAYEEQYHLPSEKPSEHEFPFSSPMDDLRDRIEEVDEEEPAAELLKGLQNVTISLMCGDLAETIKKSKYHKKFHRAFIGSLATMPLIGASDENRSHLKQAMADGSCVSIETLLHQAHFDGKVKLSFRQKVVQCAESISWSILGDKEKIVPKLEHDMNEMNARKAEQYAPVFLHFAT